jgi:hypothetical protein
MNDKRLFYQYIRNTTISFLAIAILYIAYSLLFSSATFPSKTLILSLFVFAVLFFSGWAVMLPAIYKNPRALLAGIMSLTIVQLLLFMFFAASVVYANSPMTVVLHVMCMFLALIALQALCIIKTLNN